LTETGTGADYGYVSKNLNSDGEFGTTTDLDQRLIVSINLGDIEEGQFNIVVVVSISHTNYCHWTSLTYLCLLFRMAPHHTSTLAVLLDILRPHQTSKVGVISKLMAIDLISLDTLI
jgi:hypothetical protein